jgi:uncharacterized protein (TIGR02266 family)
MPSRDFERAPGRLQVQFRSPTALLVAFSVNLSRGGMFIQCPDEMPPEGAVLDLEISLPDRRIVSLTGVVAWHREQADPTGPRGVGVQFDALDDELGTIVDGLVLSYAGIRILVLCGDPRDRQSLLRRLKSIVGTASVAFADDESSLLEMLSPAIDLVVIDADEDEPGALTAIERIQREHDVPTIALAQSEQRQELLTHRGACEVLGNPPSSSALRQAVLKLLSSPSRVVQI